MDSNRVLNKLEFDKILERLKQYCLLPLAQEKAETLVPYTDRAPIEAALAETDEGKGLLRVYPTWSVRGAKEIRGYLNRCDRGGMLTPEELLDVRDTLRTGRQVRKFLAEKKDGYVRLWSTVEFI